MRAANLATIAAFVVFLAAPVTSLVVWGYDVMAARKLHWNEVNWGKLVSASDDYRMAVAREVLIESPAGIAAIRAKSAFDYRIVGYVRTPQVLSGRDAWLFFRPPLERATCHEEASQTAALDRAEAMRVLASAAGIDLRFSVSPNKEIVHPEKLGPTLANLAICALEGAARWRRIARDMGSSVIDHLAVMQVRGSQEPLYRRSDTHWNWLGRAAALRQLAQLYLHVDPGLPTTPSGTVSETADLLLLLRLSTRESFATYETWLADFARAVSPGVQDALIVHDSFYEAFGPAGPMLFAGGTFIPFNHPGVGEAVAAGHPHILVNSVERDFFDRLNDRELSWQSSFGSGLLEANRRAAAACILHWTKPTVSPELPGSVTVDLPAGGKPCLAIAFDTTSEAPLRVWLPLGERAVGDGPGYRAGFSMEQHARAGRRSLTIVLPEAFAGRAVRWGLSSGSADISNTKIAVGKLSP